MNARHTAFPLRLERLNASHDLAHFDAGPTQPTASAFLHEEARLEDENGLSRVWVAIDDMGRVAGYLALSLISVPISASVATALGFAEPISHPVRGYRLERIGIDRRWTGRNLGDALDARAIRLAEEAAGRGEVLFIAVEARSEGLRDWYRQLGFVQLSDDSEWLVRPLA